MMDGAADEIRRLYPRILGKTLALTGSLADAEDAVQDAIERALETWPRLGVPGLDRSVARDCLGQLPP